MQRWVMAGSHPEDYELGIDTIITYQGKNSGYIKQVALEPEGFGTVMQKFQAHNYRNKRLCFAAQVKSEGIEGWAGLWMRVDGPEKGKPLRFDNMQNRPIKGTNDWQKYEIVLDVPQESRHIAFGLLLRGKGQAWLSNIHFEEVGSDILVTGRSSDDYLDTPGNLDFAH